MLISFGAVFRPLSDRCPELFKKIMPVRDKLIILFYPASIHYGPSPCPVLPAAFIDLESTGSFRFHKTAQRENRQIPGRNGWIPQRPLSSRNALLFFPPS